MNLLTKFRITGCYFTLMMVVLAVIGISFKGLNLGLDFTGGYLTEFNTSGVISQQEMQQGLSLLEIDNARINSADGGTRWTLRLQDKLGQEFDSGKLEGLSQTLDANIKVLDSVYIGGQVGADLLEQGGLALLVAGIAILLYLSMRFEWRLGVGSLVALFHDVLFVLGIFAWLELSFDLTVMAAILAIIGYSLNDSIVVGDRIRELLNANSQLPLNSTIDLAIKTTLTRTMITSGTTLVTIGSIWLLAGKPLEGFSIALFIGVVAGSLSSITLSATLPPMLGLDANYYRRQAELIEERQRMN